LEQQIPSPSAWRGLLLMCEVFYKREIIFEVREDEVDGGFVAIALGHAIATQGDTL
jgi:hypothetical protein